MSRILDALRRGRRTQGSPGSAPSEPRHAVHADAVLATLGYGRSTGPGGKFGRLITVAVVIVAIGGSSWLLLDWAQDPRSPTTQVASAPSQTVPAGTATTPVTPEAPVQAPSQLSAGGDAERPAPPAVQGSPEARAMTNPMPPPVVGPTVVSPRPIVPEKPATTSPPTRQPAATPSPAEQPVAAPLPAEALAAASARTEEPAAALPTEGSVVPATASAVSTPDHFRLALYYQRAGDFEKALTHYRALLQQDELNAEVHNNLGLLYQQKGLLGDAVQEFQRAIFIDQRYVKAHNNLGVAFFGQGRLDAAAAEFRTVLGIDPRNVDALVNLTLVDKSRGQPTVAQGRLFEALQIDPRNAAAHFNLGLLFEEAGEKANAVRHYQQFLDNAGGEHADLASDVRVRVNALSR